MVDTTDPAPAHQPPTALAAADLDAPTLDLDGYAGGEQVPEPLRADVRLLGALLGQVMQESGHERVPGHLLLAATEQLRRAVIDTRRGGREPAEPRRIVEGFDADLAESVARAFATFFQLANLAEERERARALRADTTAGPVPAAVAALREEIGGEALQRVLDRLRIHPVLTAHPTEMRRRAVVAALARVRDRLDAVRDPGLAGSRHAEAERRLLEEITILWRTGQLRRERPGVLDEVRTILAVFDTTLFLVAPRLYRSLERALEPDDAAGTRRPSARAFLRIGSWVGGDRDGNPLVTAGTTSEAVGVQADLALTALHKAAVRIGRTLTLDDALVPPDAALQAALDADAAEHPALLTQLWAGAPGAPHRVKVMVAAERLAATRARQADLAYTDAAELVADLRLVQASLAAGGAPRAAYGELQHLVWQAETFGLTLAGLEVRQSAEVHRSVLAQLLGADHPGANGDAAALDRLATDGWPDGTIAESDLVREVLTTLRVVASLQQRWGSRVCRRYVVSHTSCPADLVAPRALARLAVADRPLVLQVVPLLESVEDLEAGVDLLQTWLALPGEQRVLEAADRQVEVMLGYSDSAKGAGPVSAALTLYRTEQRLVAWAERTGLVLTLFHGRGGALGRGGGPAHRALLAQAPGSVGGVFKLTEQGEIVAARYGDLDIAERHLEQVTAAVLLAESPRRQAEHRRLADTHQRVADLMDGASRAAWTALVGADGFAEFVTEVTPLAELAEMQVGSRPAARPDAGRGLSALRAIPWIHAWAQSRINLPGWFGLGAAVAQARAELGDDNVLAALREHPLLATLIDNAEMSLAKSDEGIASGYLELGGRPDLTQTILIERSRTVEQVLWALGTGRLLETRRVLGYAVALRAPYVDALSHLQLDALRALRDGIEEGPERDRLLRRVLLTAGGVAAGLQNTG